MSRNPIVNALSASLYIVMVVAVMTFGTAPLRDTPDTFFAPVTVLFVLTLSVAVMAYMFFYQPVLLFIEGKKKEGVGLLVKTIGVFAVITLFVLSLLLLRII